MQIVRWFMSHPIIAAWSLAGLAIVLNLGVGSGGKDNHAVATDEVTAESTEHHKNASIEKETSKTAAVDTDGDKEKAKVAAIGEVPQAPEAPEAPTADEAPVPASVIALSGTAIATHDIAHDTTDKKAVSPTVATPKVTMVATTPEVSIEAGKALVPVTVSVTEATKIAPTAPTVPTAPAIPVAPAAAPATNVVVSPSAPVAPTTSAAPIPAAHVAVEPTQAVVATSAATVQQATTPETPVTATTAVVTSTPEVQKAAVATKPATVESSNNKPTLTGFEGKSPAELLQHARMAFNQKAMDKSVAIYQYLIKQQPNVLEYKGELGNVFYHQRKPKEAAALYAEISLPLIQQGKGSQVSNMLGFIGAFYPEKATEISKHLMSQ